MPYLQCASIVLMCAAIGCAAPQADSSGAGATAAESAPASAPTPAVSHAADTGRTDIPSTIAPADTPSTTAHHSDRPSEGPSVNAENAAAEIVEAGARPPAAARTVTLPAGTALNLKLATPVSSSDSRVEDVVQATVSRAVVINGATVVPAGARVSGYVTEAAESGRVKGRARVGVRFDTLRVGSARYEIRTSPVTRQAPGTKKADAAKIGIGAGAGAIVGGIAGGKKGAAVGTAVGAAGGTGVVLATRGEDVRLARGSVVTARLSRPVTIRIN